MTDFWLRKGIGASWNMSKSLRDGSDFIGPTDMQSRLAYDTGFTAGYAITSREFIGRERLALIELDYFVDRFSTDIFSIRYFNRQGEMIAEIDGINWVVDNATLLYGQINWAEFNTLDDTFFGAEKRDKVFAGPGNDVLLGDRGNDLLSGDGGRDVLMGQAGRDDLRGGRGQDVLDGGKGNDKLRGGSGSDTFYFEKGTGRDRVLDYNDRVDFIAIEGYSNRNIRNVEFIDTGKHTLIKIGRDSVLFHNTEPSEFDAGDFLIF